MLKSALQRVGGHNGAVRLRKSLVALSRIACVAIMTVSGCRVLETGRSEGETALRHEKAAEQAAAIEAAAARALNAAIDARILAAVKTWGPAAAAVIASALGGGALAEHLRKRIFSRPAAAAIPPGVPPA